MDNRTEDSTPEYSSVDDPMTSTIPTKKNPSYELRTIQQSKQKETNENNSKRVQKCFMALIIMMVILLFINILTIGLSVAIYTQLSSTETEILNKIDKLSNDTLQEIIGPQCSVCQNNKELLLNISKSSTELLGTLNIFLLAQSQCTSLQIQMSCGPGLWYRVAYLNMSNPAEQCPSAWREYNYSGGVRACGRPASTLGSCPDVQYSTFNQYSRVCGRIIGYQVASPDAFRSNNNQSVDGVTITHGTQHIWSYVAGVYEHGTSMYTCPCSSTNGQEPPPSIGNNYYCESGNSMSGFTRGHLYLEDKLWDGQQCEGTCCCNGTNSPPWFSVQLPAPTTDAIEVSICCDQGTNDEDVPVKLIEIFVQ